MTRIFQKIISVFLFIFLCGASSHFKITKEKPWGLIKTGSRREALPRGCSMFSSLNGEVHMPAPAGKLHGCVKPHKRSCEPCRGDCVPRRRCSMAGWRDCCKPALETKRRVWPLGYWWQLGLLLPARGLSWVFVEELICCSLWVSPSPQGRLTVGADP